MQAGTQNPIARCAVPGSLRSSHPGPTSCHWPTLTRSDPNPTYPARSSAPRSYNFLIHVPYQLERLIAFGFLMLLDSFLVRYTPDTCRVIRVVSDARCVTRARARGQPTMDSFLVRDTPATCRPTHACAPQPPWRRQPRADRGLG